MALRRKTFRKLGLQIWGAAIWPFSCKGTIVQSLNTWLAHTGVETSSGLLLRNFMKVTM